MSSTVFRCGRPTVGGIAPRALRRTSEAGVLARLRRALDAPAEGLLYGDFMRACALLGVRPNRLLRDARLRGGVLTLDGRAVQLLCVVVDCSIIGRPVGEPTAVLEAHARPGCCADCGRRARVEVRDQRDAVRYCVDCLADVEQPLQTRRARPPARHIPSALQIAAPQPPPLLKSRPFTALIVSTEHAALVRSRAAQLSPMFADDTSYIPGSPTGDRATDSFRPLAPAIYATALDDAL